VSKKGGALPGRALELDKARLLQTDWRHTIAPTLSGIALQGCWQILRLRLLPLNISDNPAIKRTVKG
jgi:hypothetical protein